MNHRELVSQLESNRQLRSPEQVAAFDEALERLTGVGEMKEKDLTDLFKVFSDDCENEEVMFGLVHLIEDSDLRDMLRAFISAVPEMSKRAPEWVKLFHYRILNSDRARALYGEMLTGSDLDTRRMIRHVLTEIATAESPPLSTRAGAVLQTISGGV